MRRHPPRRWVEPVVLAAPALALAVAGLFHPHRLTPDTAFTWWALHLPALLVFPLVGVSLLWLVRGRNDPLAWVARVAAYGYATFYTALDAISGVAAGYVTDQLGADAVPRPPEISLLFRIGTPIGDVGAWCLLVAALALLVDRAASAPRAAAPGVLLVAGAWLLRDQHIFSPWGVVCCLAIGLGTAGLAAVRPPAEASA